jgi:hypothetical protein
MLDSFDNVVGAVSLMGVERSSGGEAGGARPVSAEPIRWNVRNDHDSSIVTTGPSRTPWKRLAGAGLLFYGRTQGLC